jgi:hypothetical protein
MPSENPNIINDISSKTTIDRYVDIIFKNSPFNNIFIQNYRMLKKSGEKIDFSKDSWNLNPQQLSLEYYNSVNLYHVIMLVNDITSIALFKKDNFKNNQIIIPSFNFIRELISFV